MLPVNICCENENDISIYKALIIVYAEINKINDIRNFYSTTCPDKLIEFLKKRSVQSLYFIDVGEENISLAENIRKYDPRAYIILVSGNIDPIDADEHMMEILSCVKGTVRDNIEHLYKCISMAYTHYSKVMEQTHGYNCLHLSGNGEFWIIPQNDIYYISVVPEKSHCLNIYTEKDCFPFRNSLSEIIKLLGPSFFKCDRQHIVNQNHIVKIDRRKLVVILDDGTTVPCSSRAASRIKY